MTPSYRIAIVGAASIRGKQLNEALAESSFAAAEFLLMDDQDLESFYNRGIGSITGISLGVEAIGEDLEGFWEEEEAEGGARLLMGPSLRISPAGRRCDASSDRCRARTTC